MSTPAIIPTSSVTNGFISLPEMTAPGLVPLPIVEIHAGPVLSIRGAFHPSDYALAFVAVDGSRFGITIRPEDAAAVAVALTSKEAACQP